MDHGIRMVGSHTMKVAKPEDCVRCKKASYGDVIVGEICTACIFSAFINIEERTQEEDSAPEWTIDMIGEIVTRVLNSIQEYSGE